MPDLSLAVAWRYALVAAVVMLLQSWAHAQTPTTTPAPAPKATASAAKSALPVVSKPVWAELNPQQQQNLKPLAASWNGISEAQKRKWLEVSRSEERRVGKECVP